MYLRTVDYSMKKSCGIYEIESENGRHSYKIFASNEDLQLYLKKNKGKVCRYMKPIFTVEEYKEYANWLLMKYKNICQNDKPQFLKLRNLNLMGW